MARPLDELYFEWLYSQVGSVRVRNPTRTYWSLLRQLFTKEFVWIIPNDDNRIEDGRDLRVEFLDISGIDDVDPGWMELGCSFFEMMIGLSRRLSFIAEGDPRDWFWHLMDNLGLRSFNDDKGIDIEVVDEILNTVIWRTYSEDGQGGLFPLRNAREDQREVEIWYQQSAYILEQT